MRGNIILIDKQLQALEKQKIPGISKVFSVLVAALPLLATYASGIPGFSLADICLAVFVGLSLLTSGSLNRYRVRINSLIVGLIVLIAFSLLACLAGFPSSVSDVAIRTIRYGFYIAALFTAGKRFLDLPTLRASIKVISFLGSIFIMFQLLMYRVFDVIVKGYLPSLPLYIEDYGNLDYEQIYEELMYRPTSFFLEPAHYARYCIIGLILLLFADALVDNKRILGAIVCAVGIIISTSSQGYFLLAIVASMFLFTRIKAVKSPSIRLLLRVGVLLLPFLVVWVLQVPVVAETIDRTLSGSISDQNTALGARLGGFVEFAELPFVNQLIGTGFGNVPEEIWMSSAAYWLYGSGIIVTLIYLWFLFRSFFRLGRLGKYIVLVIVVLFFTDDAFYSYMIVPFFSLFLFEPKRGRSQNGAH